MKKTKLMVASLALWLAGASQAFAYDVETVENYKFDFDDPFACGFTEADQSSSTYESRNHADFAPTGWAHVVDVHGTGYSMKPVYTWAGTSGADGTGTIRIGEQEGMDYDTYASFSLNDLLITPKVSGTITIDVKNYYSASIKFYEMTLEDGQWVQGSQIDAGSFTIGYDFSTISFTVSNATYIGIRGSNVYIDNFTASKAEVEKRPALSVSVTDLNGTFNDADADGNIKLSYEVAVSNIGLVDLTEGYEGYSLSLLKGKDGDVIATQPLTAALKVGEKTTVTFETSIPAADYTDSFDAYIRENVSGKSVLGSTVKPVAYTPAFAITELATGATLSGTYDMGVAQGDLVCQFVIANNGAAPMTITSISLPEGFSTNAVAKTYAAHERDTISVTLSGEQAGEHTGDLVIKGDGIADYTLTLKGTIAEQGKWFVDFEDCDASYSNSSKFPAGIMAEASWQISSRASDMKRPGNKLNAYQYSTTETKLISPLVEVKEGDVLTFEGAKVQEKSILAVYYSADRKEWTKVYTVGGSEVEGRDADFDNTDRNPNSGPYASVYYGFDKYTVGNIPAGQWYIAFGGSYAYLDNIYGFTPVDVDHDLAITAQNLAESGMVNYAAKNEVTLYNANTKAEAADGYTAEFFIDGEKAAEAATVDLAPSASATFTFNATPHKAGTFEAYALFTFGDYTVKSDVVNITVGEETFSAVAQVGTFNGKSTAGLLDLEKKESEGAALYTADKLGLSSGTTITSLTLKGMAQQTSWSAVTSLDLKFWIANSELTELPAIDADFTLDKLIDTSAEAGNLVYDGAYEPFGTIGGHSGYSAPYTITSSGELITINFTKPFVYTGGSIVVAAKHSADNTYYYFGLESTDDLTAIGRTYAYGDWQTWGQTTYGTPINPKAAPVIYFGTEAEAPVFSGKVTGARNAALADAVVTLTAGDVVYQDVTDAQGKFSINVLQPQHEYTLTVELEGYDAYTGTVSLKDGNVEQTIKLEKLTTGIETVGTSRNGADVYTLSGQFVGRNIDPKTLKRGLYIIGNKKVVVE